MFERAYYRKDWIFSVAHIGKGGGGGVGEFTVLKCHYCSISKRFYFFLLNLCLQGWETTLNRNYNTAHNEEHSNLRVTTDPMAIPIPQDTPGRAQDMVPRGRLLEGGHLPPGGFIRTGDSKIRGTSESSIHGSSRTDFGF